jgi:retinol dehydrogenase-12
MKTAKTVVITGANAGIGLATAKGLASKGYNIVTICRDSRKGQETIDTLKQINKNIQAENFTTDLSDLNAVKQTADVIAAKYPVIDRLINNAGYYPAEIEYIDTVEKTFFASHLGHMLLTQRLMPSFERAVEARIINVSSALHSQGKVSRFFKRVDGMTASQAYGDAKLANVLFTMELSKRLAKNVTTYSLHPGVVRTNFAKGTSGAFAIMLNIMRPFFISPDKGAATSIHLADAAIEKLAPFNGQYFDKKAPAKTSNNDITDANAKALFDRSNEMLKPFMT